MIDLAEHRMALHQIPEIGFHEVKTKAYILDQVKDLGAVIHEVGKTGLVLYFDNGKVQTLAFRADMDALPVTEATGLAFASRHAGVMHACGHDGHMAMLLGLADFISRTREQLKVNVVLIFQPSEEIDGGAQSIIDSGLLETYQVAAIFGFHLWPGLKKGEIFSRSGGLMAMSSETNIFIHGKAAHIASSSQGIDAVEVAARLLTAIYDFDEGLSADIFHLLKFGQLSAGTIRNVLAAEADIHGSLRSISSDRQIWLKNQLRQLADIAEKRSGATIDIAYTDGCPPVVNDKRLMQRLFQLPQLKELSEPVLQAEDFGLYTQKYPCAFFFLGLGEVPALHTAAFDFDMHVLDKGLAFYKGILDLTDLL